MRKLQVLIVVAVAGLVLGACGGGEADPAATVEGYTAAYNAGDLEGVMTFFTEESVVTGHPLSPTISPSVVGLDEIRGLHQRDMSSAAEEDAYTLSNVEVSGDIATWDHRWASSAGQEFCKAGQEAEIKDGKFVTWTWASGTVDCP